MQSVRQRVHASRETLRAVARALDDAVGLPPVHWTLAAQDVEIEREQRELLAHVVVKLAGDACALGFLRDEQPSAEVAYSFVTRPQFAGTLPREPFRSAASSLLYEQTRDERGLDDERRHRREDVEPVAVPESGLAEKDLRSRRNTRFADVPAAKLPRVHLVYVQIHGRDGNGVGLFTVQYPQAQLSNYLCLRPLPLETPANDAMIQRGIDPRIHWRIRDRRESIQVVDRSQLIDESHAVVDKKIDRGSRREQCQPRFEDLSIQIGQECKRKPVRELAKLLSRLDVEALRQAVRRIDHEHAAEIGLQRERQRDRAGQIRWCDEARRIVRPTRRRPRPKEHDRRRGIQLG